MNRSQLAFAIFGVLVVCSLIAASVGTVAVELILDDDADPGEFDANADPGVIEELQRQIEENPQDTEDEADEMALLGELLAAEGRIDEAIRWYERALTLRPFDTGIRLSFARDLMDAGKRSDAELQFRRVIEADPGNYEAHYYLAELYRGWDPPRLDEAVSHYSRVIEIAPTDLLATLAGEQLTALGYATPVVPATPLASPAATPELASPEGSG